MQLKIVCCVIFIVTGGYNAFAWSTYDGEEVDKLPSTLSWSDAVTACLANYSIVASPVRTSTKSAVVAISIEDLPKVPESMFWTGFRRNHPDGLTPDEWVGDLHRATNESFLWRNGFNGEEPGDCLAMEVLPTGITFYPNDCTSKLYVACHKFKVTYPTEEISKNSTYIMYHSVDSETTSEDDCARKCVLDRNCEGYKFENSVCYTLNETSFDEVILPPAIECTSTNQTACEIVDCLCNETSCQLESCDLLTNSTNCTFEDCSDSVICQPFTDNTCIMNDSLVFINCSSFIIPSCFEVTTQIPVPTIFTYTHIIGCVSLIKQPNTRKETKGWDNKFNSTHEFQCLSPYMSSQDNGTLPMVMCDSDRRWSFITYCWIDAPKCELGWHEFEGSCYKIEETPTNWFEQTCELSNAFPVYIESWDERKFVNKLLFFHQNESFWTDGSNLNIRTSSRFYWKHNYLDMTFDNWRNAPNGSFEYAEECVALKERKNSFLYYARDCLDLKLSVCKKGRVPIGGYCLSDNWCMGGSICWYGKCRCLSLKIYGEAEDDPTAYCGYSKTVESGATLLKMAPKQWELAVAECESQDGTLLTVLTKEWEDILWTHYGNSGSNIQFWTGFYMNDNYLLLHGVAEYNVSDLTQIPWKTKFKSSWSDGCVYQRISMLGIRYGVKPCGIDSQLSSICKVEDHSVYFGQNLDNTELPIREYKPVITEYGCMMKCRYLEDCVSISYFPVAKICKLYNVKSPGISGDPPNLHMYITGCTNPGGPKFGSVAYPATSVGSVATFSCDAGHAVPTEYSDSLNCQDGGYWDNVPKCVLDGPLCDEGWEQMNQSCYLVEDDQVSTWVNAVTKCNSLGATLAEIYSNEEMDYLKVLLDHIGSRQYLIGANCLIMQGYYSWSSYDYAMITYTKWYKGEGNSQPSGLQDCVALQRVFSTGYNSVNDTGQLFFADSNCDPKLSAYYKSHPYICKKNMLNVGSTNCAMYGKDPCKQNSGCVNNTCVCKEFFYQLGDDNVDTTQCLPIQPVGNGPCYSMNEFCRNNATCQNEVCLCPPGYYQNGQSGSLSALCQIASVSCPDDWLEFNGHCYILDLTYPAPTANVKFVYNNNQPIVTCGKLHAYMAMIPDAETNEVIWKLGTSFTHRFIGLVDEKLDEEYIWMADRSEPTYLNFEFQNKTGVPAVMMNPVGYWIKETYTTPVKPVFKKNHVACEKPSLCWPIPAISNAVAPPVSTIGEEVGKEYVYQCNRGYVMAGIDSSFIKCREVNRMSFWDNTPHCVSLLQEKFIDVTTSVVNGIALGTSFVVVDNLDCAAYCYENSMCEAFHYDSVSGLCTLYQLGDYAIPTSSGSELWKSGVCDSIPYVEHATFTSTGRNFGDTVNFQCSPNYRIDRNTSSVLTCLPTGRWDHDPPVCKARFKRVKEAIYALSVTNKRNKELHNIFTVHDCEVKCIEEHEFRCVMSVYRWGYCTLWNQFPNHHRTVERYAEHIENAMTSTLYDSELDVYDGFYGQIINTDPGIMQGVNTSYEICAQNCTYDLNNCTAFVYMPENRTCFIYHITDFTASISEDPKYRLFKRNFVCGEPPTVPGMTFEELIKQKNDRYSIGDLLQARCENFGEELIAGHSGQIECLATGYWTQRLPVCKNLCAVGWYMFNLTCYKILPGPASFWEAYSICQSLDSGLVNVYDDEEFTYLQKIWNETGKPVTDVWIGLYSDFNFWYWSERLGGDIGFNEIAAVDLAVILSLTNTSISSDSINSLRPFACEKAAPKLSCPYGWTQFKNKCFQVQTTPAVYDNAEAGCQSQGATLAVVENLQEQHIVGQMATDSTGVSAYVGIQHQLNRPYKWVDGTVPRYKYILSIEPVGTVECGVVNIGDVSLSQMYFSMTACDTAKPYICQKQLDNHGVGNDYSNLPCSTDSFCSHQDLACLGGIENGVVYSPRCSGKECPPPWFYLNNECIYAKPEIHLDYLRAAHHCWKKGGNLAVIESFKEDYDLMDAIPSGVDWFIGIYSYLHDYPIDIRTKGPAVFPYYEKAQERGYILDTRVNRGFFMSEFLNLRTSFLCEKQPTFKPITSLMYDGCFGEKTTLYERDLPFNVFTDPGMTVEMCVNHCFNNSYKYAGIMLGDTCGCGNNRGGYGKQALTVCPIKCVGNQAQDCGGNTTNSVYRTSENNCFDGMPRSKTDQRRCYSYSQNQLTYYTNKLECLQQGGYNILPKTPVDEAFVYNQVLLGALSNEALLDPATKFPHVWLGLEGLVKTWADDGEVAYWVNFDNKNYADDWKWAGAVDLNSTNTLGTWIVKFQVGGTEKTRTACELYDYNIKYADPSLHTEYDRITKPKYVTKYGLMNTTDEFDFGCLNDRDRCPDGFTIMFWFNIKNSAQDSVLFSTGDCSFKHTLVSPGLCIYYHSVPLLITVVHATPTELAVTEFSVNLDTWTNLLLFCDRNLTVALYLNGLFRGHLSVSNSTMVKHGNVKQSDVNFYVNDVNIELKNISFIASAPDQSILEQIKDTKYDYNEKMLKTFQPWSTEPNVWSSPGVDGNGFVQPYKSFVHYIGKEKFDSACIHSAQCWSNGKTIAMWTKIPPNVKENINILSLGSKVSDGAGLWLYYDTTIHKLKIVFNTLNMYEALIDFIPGEWIHIALVVSQPVTPKLYINGTFVSTMSSIGATPATPATYPGRYFGTVMCLPGWSQFGSSCYLYINGLMAYWQLQHICESYGGHLAVIDDQQELKFVKSFLYDSQVEVYLGTYNFLMQYVYNEGANFWVTTNGQLQLYTYFDTRDTPSIQYSKYPYVATTCDPDCDNGKRYGFDEWSNVNFTGHGGLCEVSQLPFSLRREEALKCPAGWWFWNEHCYLFTGNLVYAGSATDLYCATHRAVVLEIDSIEEQRFISNLLIRESPLPKTAYIGAKFVDPLPDGSPGQFVYGDFQPPGYLNWKTGPTNAVSLGCSVIDCSDRACTWRDISCTETWPVICEMPAKSQCSPGWEEFGDKCVYINNVTASGDCSKLATFNTEAELQEFINRFDLGTRNCLTDGALTALNTYIWNSTAVPTYFTDQVLPGTGGCVGVTATGLQRIDCSFHTCAICEHSQKAGVSIDNLHILDEDMTDGDVTDLYEKEKYDADVLTFNLSQFSKNSTVTNNLALHSVLNISDNSSALTYPVGENDHCLENLGNCHHSFGVSFWIWNSNVTDCVVIDTVTDGTTGMIVSVEQNGTRIAASLLELNYRTDTDVYIPLNNEWNHINIVWQKYVGLTFFINFNLVHRVSPSDRTKVFPTMPIPVNTSYISIANCSVDPDSYLLIKDLQYGTNLKEDWENLTPDDMPRFIDFNEPSDKSNTNVNVKVDSALVKTYWRNSLFFTAAKVDNPSGVSPAMEIKEQMAMCFTNFDACRGGFTLSLWLYPRDFLQDQIFWFSGIKSHSGGELETMKIWYCTTTDKYYLTIHYDKTMIKFEFYIYLFEWSHLVLSADLSKHVTEMYLNSEKVLLKTTTFEQNCIIPRYRISFLRIGDVGTFDIDDFKFFPYAAEPSQMYVLKSCHEFMLAGITGVKNETIDPNILDDIDNKTIMECDLDLGYTGFHFAMEMNQTNVLTNTIGLDTSIEYLDMGNITYAPAIHYDGVLVNKSGFNITGLETIKCFSDVRYCYFGFTFAAWIQILDVTESLTLFELGGNIDMDEYGIRVWCENLTNTHQLNCSAVVVNGTDRWSLEFSVLKKQMLHLAVTWNPHLNLIVALNGHSTADFGRLDFVNRSIEATPPVLERPVTIGYSVYSQYQLGEFMIDELTLVDNYLEDIQIKKLFGTKHECPDMWYYSPVSDRCYFLSSTTAAYDNAVSSCQAMDAIIVQVPDLETRTWLYNFLDAEMLVPSPVYFGLKQLPRAAVGFQVRQPNGKMPEFPDSNLIFVTDFSIPRCVRADTGGGSWSWTTVNCATLQHYICEIQPMYVKESPLYVNGTNKDNEEFHLNGEVTVERGVTLDGLSFNNSANSSIQMIHADDCLSNFDYCHNGLAIKFWLMTVGDLTDLTSQIIFTNMMSTESHGFVIYIIREGTNYLLRIDLRNKISFKSSKVHVSSNVWTYMSIFISSESDIMFYMNGEFATPVTATVNTTDTSLRSFGVSADITIGSGMNGLQAASIKIDNLTFTESNTFSALSLKDHVYEFFPRFHIPFDNPQYRLPNSQGSTCYTSEGYMGNAVFHNITYPHQLNFIGQFAYDCFGSQNLCMDGFSMFVWIMPLGYTYNYALLNAHNQNTGIIIDFRLSDFTLSNKYWLAIRDGTTIEDHYPFDLVPGAWSHLGITWYTNGTKLFFVNGILVTDAFTKVNTLDGSAPVTPLQFGQTLPNTNLEIPVEAGIDEMLVIRSPIVEMDLINYYKNSTFIHTEVICEFENMSLSQEISGIWKNGARFISGKDEMNLTSLFSDSCFLDIDKCVHGFTVKFAFRFVSDLDLDQLIMTTGGHLLDGLGFSFSFTAMNSTLPFRRYFQIDVRTSDMEHTTWFNLQYGIWSDIKITWHKMFGIRVFVDDVLAVCDYSRKVVRLSPPTIQQQHLLISQDGSKELGTFDMDGLRILDVAIFEEDVLHYGDSLWVHKVHEIPDGSVLLQYTEVTRDECHQYCVENVCSGYSFCNDEHYGTCNLYSNSTNVTMTTPNQTCDSFFRYSSVSIPVQDAGCLIQNTAGTVTATPLSQSVDCAWYCKNMTYVYGYTTSTDCYCADADLETLDLFNAQNLSLSQTCGAGIPIWQTLGLRDFIRPLPITTFNITVVPRVLVFVNETVIFEFEVNEGSFAGYMIDSGDERSIFYTSYNYSGLVYETKGVYQVQITALNELSSRTRIVTIYVCEPIEGVLLNHTSIVPTNSDIIIIVDVIGGDLITCNIDFGDGLNDTKFAMNSSFPFVFTHQYTFEQQAMINVSCYNNLTIATNISSIIAINPIINLTVSAPYSLVFGENQTVFLDMAQGSNVSMNFFLDGENISNLYFPDPSNFSLYSIGPNLYKTTGEHQINLTVWNAVSGPFTFFEIFYVDISITNVTLNYQHFVATHQNFTSTLYIGNGSNVNIHLDFDDGNLNRTDFLDDDIQISDWTVDFYQQYLQPGVYSIKCYLENSVSNYTIIDVIYVETAVHNITLYAYEVSNPIDDVNLTLSIPNVLFSPTNAFMNISYGNGFSELDIPVEFVGTSMVILYNYTVNGIYNVTIDIWNNVSVISFSRVLVVGQPITNLTAIPHTFFIAIGDMLTLSVNVESGSQIQYIVDFADGEVDQKGISYTYPDTRYVLQKSYRNAGVYMIDVYANNTFNSKRIQVQINVQEKVLGMSVLTRHVAKMLFPMKYTILLNQAGTNSCFHFDFGSRQHLVGGYHCL